MNANFKENLPAFKAMECVKMMDKKQQLIKNENDFTIIHSRLFASIRGE
jgi:hypothetical protein